VHRQDQLDWIKVSGPDASVVRDVSVGEMTSDAGTRRSLQFLVAFNKK
jgi:hypothetical protein